MVGSAKGGVSSRTPSSQSFPWLMFTHGKPSKYIQTFYNIAENRSLMRKLPDLSNNNSYSYVYACCEGWLITHDDDNNCFLLNLVSKEKLLLPPLQDDFNFRECILISSPSSINCMVMFLSTSHVDNTKDRIMLWRPRQENWDEWEMNVRLQHLTVCDGKVYGFENSGFVYGTYLVVLDIVGNEPPNVRRILNTDGPITTPEYMHIGTTCSITYLVGSCGSIFLVHHNFATPRRLRAIQVFKFNLENIVDWVEVNDLGDRVFFLNERTNSFSCSASESGLQRNSIYFAGDSSTNDKKNMYWYNVTEDRLYRTPPCPNVKQRCWITMQ